MVVDKKFVDKEWRRIEIRYVCSCFDITNKLE